MVEPFDPGGPAENGKAGGLLDRPPPIVIESHPLGKNTGPVGDKLASYSR